MADTSSALPPNISEPKPEQSLLARMMNIFAAPGEAFDAIKDKEPDHGNWLAPALLLLLVSWVGAWVVFSQPSIQQQMREATDKAIDRQIASQHLSQEQGDKMREAAEKVGGIGQKVAVFAMPAFVAFVTPFFVGLIFWLVAEFAWKAELPYMKVVEVIGLSAMIAVLDAIVRSLLILITGKVWAAFSPALLIKDFDPSNALHSLALLLNPLVIWVLIVRAIGLARVARVSAAKAGTWVIGLWCVYAGFFWFLAWGAQWMAKKMGGAS